MIHSTSKKGQFEAKEALVREIIQRKANARVSDMAYEASKGEIDGQKPGSPEIVNVCLSDVYNLSF